MASSQPFAYVEDETHIRAIVPRRILEGLIAATRQARRARPKMASSIAVRWPTGGKQLGIVKLDAGWNDGMNGFTLIVFMNNALQTSQYLTRRIHECQQMDEQERLDGGPR